MPTAEASPRTRPDWTPGPWSVYDRGIGFEVVTEDGETINQGFRETFSEADARLISSAPELLEALTQMRREWGAFGKVSGETLIQADAAISKAEGAQS
jgi:hypothetical protein